MDGKDRKSLAGEVSLWATAVAGTVREWRRRRELLARRSDEAIAEANAAKALAAAQRSRTVARRKTVTVIGALVLGSTVPAWALIATISAPSVHNGEFRPPAAEAPVVAEPAAPPAVDPTAVPSPDATAPDATRETGPAVVADAGLLPAGSAALPTIARPAPAPQPKPAPAGPVFGEASLPHSKPKPVKHKPKPKPKKPPVVQQPADPAQLPDGDSQGPAEDEDATPSTPTPEPTDPAELPGGDSGDTDEEGDTGEDTDADPAPSTPPTDEPDVPTDEPTDAPTEAPTQGPGGSD